MTITRAKRRAIIRRLGGSQTAEKVVDFVLVELKIAVLGTEVTTDKGRTHR